MHSMSLFVHAEKPGYTCVPRVECVTIVLPTGVPIWVMWHMGKEIQVMAPDSVEYLEMVNWRWMGIQKASLVGIK